MSEHQATPKPEEAKKVTSELGSNETTTSFEGASYDFGPGVMAFKSLQAAADDSPRSNSIKQFQSMADDHIDNDSNGILQLQAMADARATTLTEPIQRQENKTGLPDNLKSGMENLSGYSMDDVKVHRNSAKPAQLQAHAYAQGTDIHLGPGQEKHLPHELGHVVQQKQGRVKPTAQLKGKVNINDDAGLEKEADVLGAKALQFKGSGVITPKKATVSQGSVQKVAQLKWSLVKAAVDAYSKIKKDREAVAELLKTKEAERLKREAAEARKHEQAVEIHEKYSNPDYEGVKLHALFEDGEDDGPDHTSSEIFDDDLDGLRLTQEDYNNIKGDLIKLSEPKEEVSMLKKMLDVVLSSKAVEVATSERTVDAVNNAGGQGETTSVVGAAGQANAASGEYGVDVRGGVQIDGKTKSETEGKDTITGLPENANGDYPAVATGDVTSDGSDALTGGLGFALEAVSHLKAEFTKHKLAVKKDAINAQIVTIEGKAVKEAADDKKLAELKSQIKDLTFDVEESEISIYEQRIQLLANGARLTTWLTMPAVAAAMTAIENFFTIKTARKMIALFDKLEGNLKKIALAQLKRQVMKNGLMLTANAANATSPLTGGVGTVVAATLGTVSAAEQGGSFVYKSVTKQLGATRDQFATDLIQNFESENLKEKNEAIEALKILNIEDKVYNPGQETLKKGAKKVIADGLKTGKNWDLFVKGIDKALKSS